jgi:hypothetical protein
MGQQTERLERIFASGITSLRDFVPFLEAGAESGA